MFSCYQADIGHEANKKASFGQLCRLPAPSTSAIPCICSGFRSTPDFGNAVITAATGVGELNEGDTQAHLLEVKQVESELGTLRLSIVVSRERSNEKLSYVLAADGTPGKYKFKQSK